MRRFVSMSMLLGGLATGAGCSDRIVGDEWQYTRAYLDIVVTDAAGIPAKSQNVDVLTFRSTECSATGALTMSFLQTDAEGRIAMVVQSAPIGDYTGCVSLKVRAGQAYRDTTVSGFVLTFRTGVITDTLRTNIRLNSR